MSHFSSRWVLILLIIAGLTIVGCVASASTNAKVPPSKVEEVSGSEFARLTLTQRAVESEHNTAALRFFQASGFSVNGTKTPGNIHLQRLVHGAKRQPPLEIQP